MKALSRTWGLFRPRGRDGNHIILLPEYQEGLKRGYVSAVTIARDEGRYVEEWLAFHKLVGFEHVYFYDNGSLDETLTVLDPYIRLGFVTLIPWKNFQKDMKAQAYAYAHALCNFGPSWKWMGFFDMDEFMFPVEEKNMRSVLVPFEDLPAVCVPWFVFGFSGHRQMPNGYVTDNYKYRMPFPPSKDGPRLLHWKSIVRPACVTGVTGAHFFALQDGSVGAYDENRNFITKAVKPAKISSNVIRLNHYITKSEEEFKTKCDRFQLQIARSSVSHKKRMIRMASKMAAVEDVYDNDVARWT